MRATVFPSVGILVPLVGVVVAAAGLGAHALAILPSLTTLGQMLVAALSVFAIWAGLSTKGH